MNMPPLDFCGKRERKSVIERGFKMFALFLYVIILYNGVRYVITIYNPTARFAIYSVHSLAFIITHMRQ